MADRTWAGVSRLAAETVWEGEGCCRGPAGDRGLRGHGGQGWRVEDGQEEPRGTGLKIQAGGRRKRGCSQVPVWMEDPSPGEGAEGKGNVQLSQLNLRCPRDRPRRNVHLGAQKEVWAEDQGSLVLR